MSLEEMMAQSFETVADSVPPALIGEQPVIEKESEAEAEEEQPRTEDAGEEESSEEDKPNPPVEKKEKRSFENRIAQKHAFAMAEKERADKAETDLNYWQDAAKQIAVAYKELEKKKASANGYEDDPEESPKAKTFSQEEVDALVQARIDEAFEKRQTKSQQEQSNNVYQQKASELEGHIMKAYGDRFDAEIGSFDDEAQVEVQTLINAFKTAPNFWLEKVKKEGALSVVGFLTNKAPAPKEIPKKTAKEVLAEKNKIDMENPGTRAKETPAKAEKGLSSIMDRVFATIPKK